MPTTQRRRRVGDVERAKAAELLSDHLAAGRLDQEEFEYRLGLALTAQDAGDLGRLLADLPLPEPSDKDESADQDDGTEGDTVTGPAGSDRNPSRSKGSGTAERPLPLTWPRVRRVVLRKGVIAAAAVGIVAYPTGFADDHAAAFGIGMLGLATGRLLGLWAQRRQRKASVEQRTSEPSAESSI